MTPAEGGPPRVRDRRGAARQRQLLQVRDPPVPREVAHQHLAAPQAPVVAVAQPVQTHADDGFLPAALYQPGRDVRVVMLHGHLLRLRQRQRVLGREVLGVQVIRHHLGVETEQPPVHLHAVLVMLQRLQVLQVADVLAEERVALAREAEGVLELGARGDTCGSGRGKATGERGVAPGPADQPRPPPVRLSHGVVVPDRDLPVVDQVRVGDGRESSDLLPTLDDGLLGQVAAGHDQRPPRRPQEQHMQRRVRAASRRGSAAARRPRGRRRRTRAARRVRAPLRRAPAPVSRLPDLPPLEQDDGMLRRLQRARPPRRLPDSARGGHPALRT